MARLWTLRSEQMPHWRAVIESVFHYDFYHLPSYHALEEERGEGQAQLFVYTEGAYTIALPLLLRPLAEAPGLTWSGAGWWDATSVYGYAGPLASHPELPLTVLSNFRAALEQELRERRVVSVFSRLHPCIPQAQLLAGLGSCVTAGKTVAIDLTLPEAAQVAGYRKNHKQGVKRLRNMGMTCGLDAERTRLAAFIDIYYETMTRVQAAASYFFSDDYFQRLVTAPDYQMQLFVCELAGEPVCGGLFSLCNGTIQYHLGGTRDAYLKLAPMKLLFDTVRQWGVSQGARLLHLGGGVGAREDSLYHFKAGFSEQRYDMAIWRWVVRPDVYERLFHEKERWNAENMLTSNAHSFFPAYRRPTAPMPEEVALIS